MFCGLGVLHDRQLTKDSQFGGLGLEMAIRAFDILAGLGRDQFDGVVAFRTGKQETR